MLKIEKPRNEIKISSGPLDENQNMVRELCKIVLARYTMESQSFKKSPHLQNTQNFLTLKYPKMLDHGNREF